MRRDFNTLSGWFFSLLEAVVDQTFDIDREGAQRRRVLLQVITPLLWTGWALLTHPVRWELWLEAPVTVLTDIASAYFAADVIRHVIVLVLPYWLALRVASVFLDDVFELKDVGVAQSYINQAAFAGQYDVLRIRDGRVAPESTRSPIFRIGGPGVVLIHLENAALFERIDGEPHVVGARSRDRTLEGFERLRQVIDLRDQIAELTVHGRTQDGIHVTAKDVRVIFSVDRGESGDEGDSGFSQPYGFSPRAIQDLVYRQGPGPWSLAMRQLIREELHRFIADHTLSEFLATAAPKERASGLDAEEEEMEEAGLKDPLPQFVSRDEITDLFYNFTHDFRERARSRGVRLEWIGIGTWETPSEIIPEQHLEAWQLSCTNQVLGNPRRLRELRRDFRNRELHRLIREVPISTFKEIKGRDLEPEKKTLELLLAYREKLRNAWELYQDREESAPPELQNTLRQLTRLTSRLLERSE